MGNGSDRTAEIRGRSLIGESSLLGRYDNFPASIHGTARFTYQISTQQLQQAMLHAFYQLNQQKNDLKSVTRASPANCSVGFEFGVADADTFNFLDEEELKKIEDALKQQALRILDVFCAARYIIETAGKSKSLKFDYNMLRFAYQRKNMELFIYHERGIQRIPLEDLAIFLKNQINQELADRKQKTLTLKHLHTL